MARRRASKRDRFFWGILFMGVGILFLLDQMGYADIGGWRHWWPWVAILMGVAHLILPSRPKDFGRGVMWILFGLWFMAADRGWHGLTWNNSWPLAFVAIGASIVIEVLVSRLDAGRPEEGGDAPKIS